VLWDPLYIDATVIGEEFTENEVELFYYEDPALTGANVAEAPSNIRSQLLIHTDFKGNDRARLVRYATPKCRFASGSKVLETGGQLVAYPFTGSKNASLINSVHCKTPRWQLDGEQAESVTLSVSLNGQNYVGSLDFTFLRDLKVHRDVPMSGPQHNQSPVRLIGQGYRLISREADLKWGT